jgi:hypothetical protein
MPRIVPDVDTVSLAAHAADVAWAGRPAAQRGGHTNARFAALLRSARVVAAAAVCGIRLQIHALVDRAVTVVVLAVADFLTDAFR